MRILDRQRYWSFVKAYVICYVALVGLYIVIDAFSNLDEFTKRADQILWDTPNIDRCEALRRLRKANPYLYDALNSV